MLGLPNRQATMEASGSESDGSAYGLAPVLPDQADEDSEFEMEDDSAARAYLQGVRSEAQALPEFYAADPPSAAAPAASTRRAAWAEEPVLPAPEGCETHSGWTSEFFAGFAELRAELQQCEGPAGRAESVPAIDRATARGHCLGVEATKHSAAKAGCLPQWPALAATSQEDLGRLLTWHCEWASDCVNTLQLLSSAAWIYSLAACLEKPVPASCAAGLRSLLRSAAAARALCTSADERLPVLSLLIATAGYFGQDEDTVVLLQEHFV